MIRKWAVRLANWILTHYDAWPPPKVRLVRQFVPIEVAAMPMKQATPAQDVGTNAPRPPKSSLNAFSKL